MRRLRALTQLHLHDREGGRRPPSRCGRRVACALAALLVALAFAGCTRDDEATPEPSVAVPQRGVVTVVADGEAGAPWVSEDGLHIGSDAPHRLAARVNGTLIANLAPVAVLDPRGDAVAYNSFRGTRPVLRLRELGTGDDSVLAEGAHSAAWRADGALAYFAALEPELRHPRRYLGHVVVRRSERARPRAWTPRAGRYVVAAWAERRILFYRLGTRFPDLLVLDGPRQQRLLAPGSALVAVSPDGRRVFVSLYGASPPLVRVLDVASGAEVARLEVDAADARYVVESGSWVGELVFAATTSGIVAFRFGDGAIRVEQVLEAGTPFAAGLSEPRASTDGRKVTAWGELQPQPGQAVPQAALVECDRTTLRCIRAAVRTAAAPPRPVYNPSRP